MSRFSRKFISSLAIASGLLVLTAAAAAAAPTTITKYTETRGSVATALTYELRQDGAVLVLSSTAADSHDTVQWQTGTGTMDWQMAGTNGTNLHAVRSENVIHVTGTLKGKEVSRDVRVDGAPWYQLFGPLLDQLLPADAAQREFWVLDPSDLAAHKMQVRRAGTERIMVNGQGVEAQKIHFSPAGALAPFWGADFWYRQSDNLYVSSKLPENGKVTVTTIEGLAP